MNRAMDRSNRQRDATLNGRSRISRKHPLGRLFPPPFVLLNLDRLIDPAHSDRPIVDLLFFPTGGGKTEAYLSLRAFASLAAGSAIGPRRCCRPIGGHALHFEASYPRSAATRRRRHLRA